MNSLLENTISVEGLDNAFNVARVLIENDYQVFIQLDDCNIYIVSYAHNDLSYGSPRFALISSDEENELINNRDGDQTRCGEIGDGDSIYNDDDYDDDDYNYNDDDNEEESENNLYY